MGPTFLSGRDAVIVLLTVTITLPLALNKELERLSRWSMLSMFGVFMVGVLLVVRSTEVDTCHRVGMGCMCELSTEICPSAMRCRNTSSAALATANATYGGDTCLATSRCFLPETVHSDHTLCSCLESGKAVEIDRGVIALSPNFIQALGVMAFAYVCHHNSFLVYESLADASPARFAKVTHYSIFSAFALMVGIGFAGYLPFGDHTLGNVSVGGFLSFSVCSR